MHVRLNVEIEARLGYSVKILKCLTFMLKQKISTLASQGIKTEQ